MGNRSASKPVFQSASPFSILEVNAEATPAEIKAAYRRLAMRWHPDKCAGDAERFMRIRQAYRVLSDPVQRQAYEAAKSVAYEMEPAPAVRTESGHGKRRLLMVGLVCSSALVVALGVYYLAYQDSRNSAWLLQANIPASTSASATGPAAAVPHISARSFSDVAPTPAEVVTDATDSSPSGSPAGAMAPEPLAPSSDAPALASAGSDTGPDEMQSGVRHEKPDVAPAAVSVESDARTDSRVGVPANEPVLVAPRDLDEGASAAQPVVTEPKVTAGEPLAAAPQSKATESPVLPRDSAVAHRDEKPTSQPTPADIDPSLETVAVVAPQSREITPRQDSPAGENIKAQPAARDRAVAPAADEQVVALKEKNMSAQGWYETGMRYYEGGDDTPQDYAEAARHFRQAARQDHIGAQTLLGVMYAQGLGVPQDIQESRRWYDRVRQSGAQRR